MVLRYLKRKLHLLSHADARELLQDHWTKRKKPKRKQEQLGRNATLLLVAGLCLCMAATVLRLARGYVATSSGFDTFLLLAVLTAWLIVPTWSSLDPPRTTYIVLLAVYLAILG